MPTSDERNPNSRNPAEPHHLLGAAHHDGSELYVPAGTPALGDVVPVRVRVPVSASERRVWVRTVRDGEPRMVEAVLDKVDDDERWYVAQVPVHNPVTQYRALLDAPGGYTWLNGRGTHARDVPDGADFRLTVFPPAPQWLSETVVYQIFPDRFARSDAVRPVPDWAEAAGWDDAASGSGSGRST